MKVLFMSCHYAGYSAHLIPLVVLKRMIESKNYDTAFFLSKFYHDNYKTYFKKLGVNLLDVEYDGTISSAVRVCTSFKPDIIVDDLSFTAGYLCQLLDLPRISILRTGTFPHTEPRNKSHQHSSFFNANQFLDVTPLGLKRFTTLPEFFSADAKIVPGIKSIEILPEAIADDSSYFFSGPLILEDISLSEEVIKFFDTNARRRKVYLTYGTGQLPHPEIHECIKNLLDMDVAVITNVENSDFYSLYPYRYYFDAYLPMHYVCSHVDLVIHHAGSGAYHYPILNLVPSITIGTQCYDREEIAMRLETLGVSEHLKAPAESDNFKSEFMLKITKFFSMEETAKARIQSALISLRNEINNTAENFDFESVLYTALMHRTVEHNKVL